MSNERFSLQVNKKFRKSNKQWVTYMQRVIAKE